MSFWSLYDIVVSVQNCANTMANAGCHQQLWRWLYRVSRNYRQCKCIFIFLHMMKSSNGKSSSLLAPCEGNPQVTGGFPSQRPVTRSFDVFFDLNKQLSKQSIRWWFETPSPALWRHCNETNWKDNGPILQYYCAFQEVLREYNGVLWLDTDALLHDSNLAPMFQALQETDGALCLRFSDHSTFAVTHPGMYEYLPTDLTAARGKQWGANAMFLYRTQSIFLNVIQWWVLCALEISCMAVNHNSTRFCSFGENPDQFNTYAGCHRFDQSALNILLLNHFDLNVWKYVIWKHEILKIYVFRPNGTRPAEVCT